MHACYMNLKLQFVIKNMLYVDNILYETFIIHLILLFYLDVEFLLKHYKLEKENEEEDAGKEENEEEWIQCQKDALDISNDFVKLDDNCMEIVRYYGIREFLVLIPARKANLTDETRIKIVLSSLTIATNNANW